MDLQAHIEQEVDLFQVIQRAVNQVFEEIILTAPSFRAITGFINRAIKLAKDPHFARKREALLQIACLLEEAGMEVDRPLLLRYDPLAILEKCASTALPQLVNLNFQLFF
jgi:hypothetical protein